MLEKAPPEWVGGNGYFTAGAHRTVHAGLSDLLSVVRNITPEMVERIDMTPYTRENFIEDVLRLSEGKSDLSLVEALVDNSRDSIGWLAAYAGIPFVFSFHRQAYEINGRQRFWGGMALSVEDGGKGLIAAHQRALEKAGVEIWFNSRVTDLTLNNGAVEGVVVVKDGIEHRLSSSAVILAAGGFEASSELRAKHLGAEWKRAKVRGALLFCISLVYLCHHSKRDTV